MADFPEMPMTSSARSQPRELFYEKATLLEGFLKAHSGTVPLAPEGLRYWLRKFQAEGVSPKELWGEMQRRVQSDPLVRGGAGIYWVKGFPPNHLPEFSQVNPEGSLMPSAAPSNAPPSNPPSQSPRQP